MADNVVADAGTGGATFAADDIGGVHFPRTKITLGADGVNDGDVSSANPLPVVGPVTDAQLRATAVPVSAAALPLPAGAATEASVDGIETLLGGGLPSVLATDRLKVDGSGVTQPVSGPLTDAQLRNTPVPVSGTVTASGPVTDAQLRATAVPVSLASVPSHAVTNAGTFAVQETGAGYSSFRSLDLDETEEEVKATAGRVHGWYLFNSGAAVAFVKVYNATAANVSVGTTVPILTIPVPAGGGANLLDARGIAFDTAITVAATTGVADADVTGPAANEVVANIFFS